MFAKFHGPYTLPFAVPHPIPATFPSAKWPHAWHLEIKAWIHEVFKQITCLTGNGLTQTSQGNASPNNAVITSREDWPLSFLQWLKHVIPYSCPASPTPISLAHSLGIAVQWTMTSHSLSENSKTKEQNLFSLLQIWWWCWKDPFLRKNTCPKNFKT